LIYILQGATGPRGSGPPDYRGFKIRIRHTAIGRTTLYQPDAEPST